MIYIKVVAVDARNEIEDLHNTLHVLWNYSRTTFSAGGITVNT